MDSMRATIPFGIAQIGKSFRNEVTTKNYIFRMREFEQMEMQYFIHPSMAAKKFDYWQDARLNWYESLGIKKDHLRFRIHGDDERAHYAAKAVDVEYRFDFSDDNSGFKEMEGIHDRGNWDLSRHQEFSKNKLTVKDDKGQEYIPHIIETSGGVDRALLAFMLEAYQEVKGGRTKTTESVKDLEMVLRLDKRLAPVKAAILPLSKKPDLQKLSNKLLAGLQSKIRVMYDETASIGKRYRRQDEIGTPYCVTVDFDSLEDKKVTVRDRDTMEQARIGIDQLASYLQDNLG